MKSDRATSEAEPSRPKPTRPIPYPLPLGSVTQDLPPQDLPLREISPN